MSFIPKPQEIYKHFKGNLYQITAVAEHTETGETLVVYQALYGDFKTYARPLSMFTSRVDREKYPEAKQEFRFELQGPDAGRQREETDALPGTEGAPDALPEPGEMQSPAPEDPPEADAARTDAEETDAGNAAPESVQEAATEPEEMQSPAQEAVPKPDDSRTEAAEETDAGNAALDPLVAEFLDASEYGQRLNILAALHHRITDDMITTMAIATGVEVDEGDLERRYESLKNCLLTLEHYECRRLR